LYSVQEQEGGAMRGAARAETWAHVAAERRDIVELLTDLRPEEWLAPSLCAGWRVRDVAAHLLVDAPVRELGAFEVLTRMVRWRLDVQRANDWWVRHSADQPTHTLVSQMADSVTPGPVSRILGPSNQLRASVIHHQDMRQPLGRPSVLPPDRLRAVLAAVLTPTGSANLGSRQRANGVRLQASDLDWSTGDGPEVTGPALSLLMALAGRPAALTDLRGEGIGRLAATITSPGANTDRASPPEGRHRA
jgi:uncharacterized protein (TIGR03083 family)